MRVFVTGGNGFIGSVVVRTLIDSGHRVLCLLRDPNRAGRLAGLPIERTTGDVRDPASLAHSMAQCDGTIHLAAPGGWENDDPGVMREVIDGGARNIFDVASSLSGHRVVLVSSTAAIAASDTPRIFDEQTPFSVNDAALHYAYAKHRTELLAAAACTRGVSAIVVNPAEVYGPEDTRLVTARNLIDFATATPVLVCDGGTSIVHVDDVAAGIVAAFDRGRAGERYILGGENLTIRALAELVLELRGREARIVMVPNGLARFVARVAATLRIPAPFNPHVVPYATRYWFVDSSKATRELGIRFRGARDTIQSTLDWLTHAGYLPR